MAVNVESTRNVLIKAYFDMFPKQIAWVSLYGKRIQYKRVWYAPWKRTTKCVGTEREELTGRHVCRVYIEDGLVKFKFVDDDSTKRETFDCPPGEYERICVHNGSGLVDYIPNYIKMSNKGQIIVKTLTWTLT